MVQASLVTAAALALVAAALQLAAPTAPIGLPGCNTICGNVRVPYPFGMQSGCYRPGFNLTCDTSRHGSPRLLLGDGSLQVVDIYPQNATVRVLRDGSMVSGARTAVSDGPINVTLVSLFASGHYRMSYSDNELVLFGCDVLATLVAGQVRVAGDGGSPAAISCASFCGSRHIVRVENHYCSSAGCCQVSYSEPDWYHMPTELYLRPLERWNDSDHNSSHVSVFLAEKGWLDKWGQETYGGESIVPILHPKNDIPLILRWDIMQGLALSESDKRDPYGKGCPPDVANLCKSNKSECKWDVEVYQCRCKEGYDGNPYVHNGCQDITKCEIPKIRHTCYGDCNNLNGTYKCRSLTAATISLLTASGPALLLLVFGVILALRKVKQRRKKLLRLKYFKQNRGQLLQNLVSQRADIAENMVISVDELAKATNNFDKAWELGGGAHGTVYKGILSDQHVVAIKKSKITVQKEINEFINEVAILSQVNHRNVVKLFGCCLETEVPLLVYEFISNGTLYHHLHVDGPISLSWSNRLRIAKETANALAYLHSSVSVPIVHRDIKSSNILLDDALTVKVSDFGASRYIPVEKTGLTTIVQGTIGYLDPMCFYTGRLNEKSDVYSFGVILVELLTRKKPFSYLSCDGDSLVMHFVNLHAEGNLYEILDPQVKEEGGKEVEEVATLAALCIKMTSDDRPNMRQVEHTLEGLHASVKSVKGIIVMEAEESRRRYSMEQEFVMSASYPR